MLTLRHPYLNPRQMNSGTVDFRPPTGSGLPALANTSGLAPSYGTLGIGLVMLGEEEDTVEETICLLEYSGGASPAVVSDRRYPDAWLVTVRPEEEWFEGDDDDEVRSSFQSAVAAFRDAHGEPVAVMQSLGTRHADLQPKSGFTNLSQAPDTFDLLDASGEVIGCAFVVRADATRTSQHWVLFTNDPFDGVHCVRRTSGGYANLHAFLDAMQDLRDESPVDFSHAVEDAVHHLDLPWP